MPAMQVALTTFNARFGREAIREVDAAMFEPGASLSEAATRLGVGDKAVADYLGRLPAALQASLTAVIRSGIERGMPITFAWAPGYDYELTVWDVADTAVTHGGITVLLRSRYPGDAHPLGERTTSA